MSLIRPHTHDSTSLVTQLVDKQLVLKYSTPFSFYRVKSINQLLYGHYHNRNYIDLCDVRIFSEDTQFLRRSYFYQTATGREQLIPRMKMCGDYYSKNRTMSHYPMMIVTNTRSLFVKRDLRLKKIMAGQGSSDDSDEEYEEDALWGNMERDILWEMENSSLDGDQSAEAEGVSYDSEEYDVFDEEELENRENKTYVDMRKIEEEDLCHLMIDMGQTNIEVQPAVAISGIKLPPMSSSLALQNIQNKLSQRSQSSISIIPIDHPPLLKSSTQTRPNISTSFAFQFLNKGNLSYSNLCNKFENRGGDILKPKRQSVTVDTLKQSEEIERLDDRTEAERLEMQGKRRKIRQKAQQLLRRVRKQEIIKEI